MQARNEVMLFTRECIFVQLLSVYSMIVVCVFWYMKASDTIFLSFTNTTGRVPLHLSMSKL